MKRFRFILISMTVLTLLVTGCGTSQPAANTVVNDANVLIVTDGTMEKHYTADDLKQLPTVEASFNGVAYQGVTLTTLLQDAGLDPQVAKAVKAVATDGFSVNYEPELFTLADTLVAYAQANGPLTADDGNFRMVLPDQEGKLNVRMLAKLEVVQ